jgi:hypothetical protein
MHSVVKHSNSSGFLSFSSLSIMGCVLAVFLGLFIFQPSSRPFQSDDYRFRNAKPCPQNGVCRGGKLYCSKGYYRDHDLCREDTKYNREIDRLATKVSRYIASRPGASCTCSRTVARDELQAKFRDRLNEALSKILNSESEFQIAMEGDGYVAKQPIPTLSCRFASWRNDTINHTFDDRSIHLEYNERYVIKR